MEQFEFKNKELGKLTQACLDEFGEKHQEMLMIEEMSELTIELCHYSRGRNVGDKVCAEIADVYAVLDQMDYLFGTVGGGDDGGIDIMSQGELFEYIISVMGNIQNWLASYSNRNFEKETLRGFFLKLRWGLDGLTRKFGKDEIEKWKIKKAERMVARLKARGVEI
jgi:hypothetical protein